MEYLSRSIFFPFLFHHPGSSIGVEAILQSTLSILFLTLSTGSSGGPVYEFWDLYQDCLVFSFSLWALIFSDTIICMDLYVPDILISCDILITCRTLRWNEPKEYQTYLPISVLHSKVYIHRHLDPTLEISVIWSFTPVCIPRLSISLSLLVYRHDTNKLSDTEHLVLPCMPVN